MGKECQVDGCDRSAITRGWCEMHYRRVLRTGDPGPPGTLRSRGTCEVDGCEAPTDAKDLCHGHYQRLLRNRQEIDSPLRGTYDSCVVDLCERPVHAYGYCASHYRRLKEHGSPMVDVPIKRVSGNGYLNHGYRITPVPKGERDLSKGQSKMSEHRLVMAQRLGRALSSDEQVHHINGVRTDNRIENLELWSTSHPSGQRVTDMVEFCVEFLERYIPILEILSQGRLERRSS